jgi:hypothetical protein
LTWQRTVSGSRFTFQAASEYCANLTLANREWHLPSLNELGTLVIETNYPTIDGSAFPATPVSPFNGFWTSTASAISFDEGMATSSTDNYVRCVEDK